MSLEYKKRYLHFIAIFMCALVISIPFYTSNVMAAGEPGDLPDAGQACIEKAEKTNFLVDMIDNDVIKILEKITMVLQTLSAVWSTIKGACLSLALILYKTGIAKDTARALQNFVSYVDIVMLPINKMIGCEWATWCSFELFEMSPQKGETQKQKVTMSIGPYENIYAAMLCLCPTAVLVNLRKLRTIYQTYDCCIEEACKNGESTIGCEKQLSEAECMYWGKGAIANMLVGIIIAILGKILVDFVLSFLSEEMQEYVGAILGLAMLPLDFKNIAESIEKMGQLFSDPDCSELGFDKIREEGEPK